MVTFFPLYQGNSPSYPADNDLYRTCNVHFAQHAPSNSLTQDPFHSSMARSPRHRVYSFVLIQIYFGENHLIIEGNYGTNFMLLNQIERLPRQPDQGVLSIDWRTLFMIQPACSANKYRTHDRFRSCIFFAQPSVSMFHNTFKTVATFKTGSSRASIQQRSEPWL